MLVLSRRLGETILIDNNIKVTVLGITGNQVRVGIAAPEGVVILREEIAPGGNKYRERGVRAINS